MPAYVVIDSEVTDPERYKQYLAAATPVVPKFGGRFLARGGAIEVLEGDWSPRRVVVTEFPSREAATNWYRSKEYQAAKKLREGAARLRMIVVDGAPPAP